MKKCIILWVVFFTCAFVEAQQSYYSRYNEYDAYDQYKSSTPAGQRELRHRAEDKDFRDWARGIKRDVVNDNKGLFNIASALASVNWEGKPRNCRLTLELAEIKRLEERFREVERELRRATNSKEQRLLNERKNSITRELKDQIEDLRYNTAMVFENCISNCGEESTLILLCAKDGELDAQYHLANGLLFGGLGFYKDAEAAFKMLDFLARKKKYKAAYCLLAVCYIDGLGVNNDMKKGRVWLERAIKVNDKRAWYLKATLTIDGVIYKQDENLAINYYKQAAELGHVYSHYILGLIYLTGSNGQQINAKKGEYHMEIAVKAGVEEAIKAYNIYKGSESTQNEKENESFASSGTGWFFNETDIATCYHVVKGRKRFVLVDNESKEEHVLTLVGYNEKYDIAILRLSHASKFKPENFLYIKPTPATIADEVFTMGFPDIDRQGMNVKYTSGDISATTGIYDDTSMYQISVPVQGGNSGGPLCDENGYVIGLIASALKNKTLDVSVQNVSYATKVESLLTLAKNKRCKLPNLPDETPTRKEARKRCLESVFLILAFPE